MPATRHPAPPRRRLFTLRAVSLLVAVLALLAYANLSQADADASAAFSAAAYASGDALDSAVAARHTEVVVYAVAEYVALVVAGIGALVALLGPRLTRPRLSRPER